MSYRGEKPRKFTADNPYDTGDRSFHFRSKREELSTGFDHDDTNELDAVKRAVDLSKLHKSVDKTDVQKGQNPSEKMKVDIPNGSKEKESDNKEILDTALEIFDNLDTQKYYVSSIREILETPYFGDKLHDFIMANKVYYKGSYNKLNSNWRSMLGFNPNKNYEGKNVSHTNMRIAAASQLLMIEYYKTHVFETEKKINLNPWRFADGKTGAYTVSVYSEYWKSKYSANSDRKQTNRTVLTEGYSNKKPFDNAMSQLNTELQNSGTDPTPKLTSEENKKKQDTANEIATRLPSL